MRLAILMTLMLCSFSAHADDPTTFTVQLADGTQIVLTLDGEHYTVSAKGHVPVTDKTQATNHVDLSKKTEEESTIPGIVMINTKPKSEVFIGDKSYGLTPLKIDLEAGTYSVTLVPEEGQSVTKTVKVLSGQKTKLLHRWQVVIGL